MITQLFAPQHCVSSLLCNIAWGGKRDGALAVNLLGSYVLGTAQIQLVGAP